MYQQFEMLLFIRYKLDRAESSDAVSLFHCRGIFCSEIQNKMDLQLFICVYELVCAMIKNPRRMDLITFGKRTQQLFFIPLCISPCSVRIIQVTK